VLADLVIAFIVDAACSEQLYEQWDRPIAAAGVIPLPRSGS
jgi:hypothetical protein